MFAKTKEEKINRMNLIKEALKKNKKIEIYNKNRQEFYHNLKDKSNFKLLAISPGLSPVTSNLDDVKEKMTAVQNDIDVIKDNCQRLKKHLGLN
jgi:UDP-N-acetylmuramoylalanine-D-glutamate ligase